MHVDGECVIESCEVINCNSRHPKVCRYLRDYRYCKFGTWCKFSHKNLQNSVNGDLDKKLKPMEITIIEKEVVVEDLGNKINLIEESIKLLEEKEHESVRKIELLLTEKLETLQNTVQVLKNV